METTMQPAVRIYTEKDTIWVNAAGDNVPKKFITSADKMRESGAARIMKAALDVEQRLENLYALMREINAQVADAVKKEFELKNGRKKKETKGGLTWYSFDNSIKVEISIDDVVKWDDAIMTEARKLFNEYIDHALSDDASLIKKMVNDAFSNNKGTIDSKKVFQLLKYEGQIKSEKFNKACELMRSAQRIDKTKLYQRVWVRMQDGSYRNINLNFTSL